MKKTLIVSAALMAVAMVPKQASAAVIVDPCSYTFVSSAIACQGYVGGNLITGGTGSSTSAAELVEINQLLAGPPTSNGPTYAAPYTGLSYGTVLGALTNLNGSATMNFGSLNLSGLTILGAHFGNNIDSDKNNVTAFWLIDLGNVTTHTLTFSNGQGSSNAQIFATGGTRPPGGNTPGVPEPTTWAMMLVGFGMIGTAMRRRRKTAVRMAVA